MKLRSLVVLVAIGALLVAASSAIARTSYTSTIKLIGSEALANGRFVDNGVVTSTTRACSRLRLVKVVATLGNGQRTVLDYDVTSYQGAWATVDGHAPYSKVTATAVKERLHHGRIICQPASVGVYRAP